MRNIELPPLMRHLPTHNGYPVPFFAAIIDGKPDPRLAGLGKGEKCARRRICWVCGQPLHPVITFIGGPISEANLSYTDGPMHEECSTFALKVCPYLAVTKRDRREEDILDRSVDSQFGTKEKPERFGQLFCRGFNAQSEKQGQGRGRVTIITFKVVKSTVFKTIWWQGGEIISGHEST